MKVIKKSNRKEQNLFGLFIKRDVYNKKNFAVQLNDSWNKTTRIRSFKCYLLSFREIDKLRALSLRLYIV